MFGIRNLTTALAALWLLVGCGSGDLDVYDPGSSSGETTSSTIDAGGNGTDDDTPDPDPGGPAPNDVGEAPDMGAIPDMPTIDMELPDPDPTTNVPQQGPTVGEQVTSSCSTISVKGLSLQLMDQMNCLEPGLMKSFEGAPSITYGASVFPFQQGPATDVFTAVAANNPGTITVNSALRTIPQQYLLYQWYVRGLCNANLAARPGQSNHNGGLAVDINDGPTWRSKLRPQSYIDNVSGEPWHFYYSGPGGKDVRSTSVLAFQQLYNYNFPENPLVEDGAYGPMTEAALRASPANGFTAKPRCEATSSLVAYPHSVPLDVQFELFGMGAIGVRTLAPSGIELVEYYVNGELVGSANADTMWFETVFDTPETVEDVAEVEIVAYDARGAERGRARGMFAQIGPASLFVRPVGGHNYEIGFFDLPDTVRMIDYFIDGIPAERDTSAFYGRGSFGVNLQGDVELGVVLFDQEEQLVDMQAYLLAL